MQRTAAVALKVLIAFAGVLTVLAQVFVIPGYASMYADELPEVAHLQVPGMVGCIAILVCFQVALACIWRLLTLVSGSRIFQASAFRVVDVLIGAVAAMAVLFIAAWVVLDQSHALGGGTVLPVGFGILGSTGLTLLLVVLRGLLRQAATLEQDLAEVI